MLVTWTTGSWANRLVTPEEEAAHLEDYFTHTAKVTIPVAIWKGNKVVNEDGGITPENAGPNVKHYPMFGKPMIWVLDGKGIIRRVLTGYDPREAYAQLAETIEFLQREAAMTSATAFPAGGTSQVAQ
jgi:hypothetical protein